MTIFSATTTEIGAVNQMLDAIGEDHITSLADASSESADAQGARELLHSISREMQAKGWIFNTEEYDAYPLSYPDNEIILPANTLRIDVPVHLRPRYIQRGSRLYDRENKTYTFSEAIPVSVIIMLDFDELPEIARNYCTRRGTYDFQKRWGVPKDQLRYTEEDVYLAQAQLEQQEARSEGANLLKSRRFTSIRRKHYRIR